MESPVVALYDCRSKQEYIYRTNKIKEIVGASEILKKIYIDFIKKAQDEGISIKNEWENSKKDFSINTFLSSTDDAEVIYIGGGNLYNPY